MSRFKLDTGYDELAALPESHWQFAWIHRGFERVRPPVMMFDIGLDMKSQLLTSEENLNGVAEVLLQLRPQYDLESLKSQIRLQQESGYNLAYVKSDEKVLCVAGFVVGQKLAWGKHIYIDDLVTDENHRSSGAGTVLIGWLKEYAREIGCGQLHLDSGVQRFPAHRFYLREGFNIASHHFSIAEL